MPKQQTKQEAEFNREEWLRAVKERVMKEPWGSGRLWSDGVLTMEIVRVGESEDVMLRIRTPKMNNAVKITRREHVDSLIDLAKAIAENEKNLRDKLEAIREVLRSRVRTEESEEL
jgi:hypothetical protein